MPPPLLADRDIVLFSSDDFEAGLKTSKHQLTARLARDNRVLFVESVGLRRPGASGKDLGRIWHKLRRFLAGPRQREAGLWILTPLAIPLHDQAWARRFNAWFLAVAIRWAMRRLAFRDVLLWVFLPTAAGVVGRLGERVTVYYNVDDFAEFTGSRAEVVNALDEQLTRAADVVFCSAQSLADRKRELNPNTHYAPHGVDVAHFSTAMTNPPPPADVADLTSPVLGYWGWIADYFDTAAIAYLAQQRPSWTILLIGESTIDLSELTALPNVRLLGQRPYETLPAYAAVCDVLLLVRRLNRLTLSMNPLKLREYLACGRPVISSPLPEVTAAKERDYGEAVQLATTPEEFLAAAERLLAERQDPAAVAALVAAETWEARLDAVAAEVLAAEARRAERS